MDELGSSPAAVWQSEPRSSCGPCLARLHVSLHWSPSRLPQGPGASNPPKGRWLDIAEVAVARPRAGTVLWGRIQRSRDISGSGGLEKGLWFCVTRRQKKRREAAVLVSWCHRFYYSSLVSSVSTLPLPLFGSLTTAGSGLVQPREKNKPRKEQRGRCV